MGAIKRHPVAAFFVLAFALTWAVWAPMALIGAIVYQGWAWPTHTPGLFGPAIAAFVITALVAGRAGFLDLLRRIGRWRVSVVWYAVALSPLAFFAIAAVATGSIDFGALGRFSGVPVLAAPVMFLVLLVFGFGEEIGWRGFAVPKLLEKHGLLATALGVGVLWAAWHVPSLFFIENYRELGVGILPMFLLGIVCGSIFLTWLYRASGGSILICGLWHGAYNLTSATAASHGTVAAVVSSGVMAWAAIIVVIAIWRQMNSGSLRKARLQS